MDPVNPDPLERDLRDLLSHDRLSLPGDLVALERVHAGAGRRRRRRAVASVAAGVVLVAAAAGTVAVVRNGQGGPVTPVSTATPTGASTGSPTPSASAGQPLGPAWGDARVVSVTATSTRTLVVLGALGNTGACRPPDCLRIAESHDGGATFSTLPVPQDALGDTGDPTSTAGATQIRFGSAQDGWLYGGGLWASHDGGHGWRRVEVPGPVRDLEAAAGTAWALVAGRDGTESLWGTPVGRDEWQRVPQVAVTGPAALAVQGRTVTVLGAEASAAWSNAGGDFARVTNPCDGAVAVRLSASGSLWATCVTGTAAYVTTSRDGASWAQVPVDTGQGALPNSLVVGARTSTGAMVWPATGPSGLAQLSADGTLTAVRDTGPGVSWIGFTDPGTGYLVTCCSVSRLERTDDGGRTWRPLDLAAAAHD